MIGQKEIARATERADPRHDLIRRIRDPAFAARGQEAELDHVLDQLLAFGRSTTSLVQSTPVVPRLLPLPDERGRGK